MPAGQERLTTFVFCGFQHLQFLAFILIWSSCHIPSVRMFSRQFDLDPHVHTPTHSKNRAKQHNQNTFAPHTVDDSYKCPKHECLVEAALSFLSFPSRLCRSSEFRICSVQAYLSPLRGPCATFKSLQRTRHTYSILLYTVRYPRVVRIPSTVALVPRVLNVIPPLTFPTMCFLRSSSACATTCCFHLLDTAPVFV